jgi:hypothetical protein
MKNGASRWSGRALLVAGAALASACSDGSPVAPLAATTVARHGAAGADINSGNRLPDLTGCEQLAAPAGSTLLLHAYGVGVQIYRWNGTTWQFVEPSATLFADVGDKGEVATHFGGPTWKFVSGGTVVGSTLDKCTPDAASIPWLKLSAKAEGAGVFGQVNFIQRLETVGGNAPSTPGGAVGDIAKVPYTADYLFYRAPESAQ